MVSLSKIKVKLFNIVLAFALFCVIYNPPILSFNCMHLIAVFSLIYCCLRINEAVSLVSNKYILGLILVWLGSFAYLLAVALVSYNGRIVDTITPIYFMIDILPFSIALSLYFKKHCIALQSIMDFCFAISILQAVLAILSYVSKPIQMAFVQKMVEYGYGEIYYTMAQWRIYGFAAELNFSSAIFQSVFAVVALNYVLKGKKIYLPISILLIFSAFINARTSIVVLIIGIAVIFLFSDVPIEKRFIRLTVIGLVMILALLFVFEFILTEFSSTTQLIKSGVTEIIGLFTGDTENGYFSYMLNPDKRKIPETILSVLFGEGHIIMGGMKEYGVSSDIGYINDVWRGGIIYIFFWYSAFFYMMLRIIKNCKAEVRFLMQILLFVLPIINIKGQAFLVNDITKILVIIYILFVSKCMWREGNVSREDKHRYSSI